MENSLVTPKIYTTKAIWVATFLGGPFAAGYLISQNFKTFGQSIQARNTWILCCLLLFLIIGVSFVLRNNTSIPNQVIPIIYTVFIYQIAIHFQGENIKLHLDINGKVHTWQRTAMITLLSFVVSTLLLLSGYFILETLLDGKIMKKSYGDLMHEIEYHEKKVQEKEIDRIADGLTDVYFFDQFEKKIVFVDKEDDKYLLSIAVVGSEIVDTIVMQTIMDVRNDLQMIFPENKIVFRVVDVNSNNLIKQFE